MARRRRSLLGSKKSKTKGPVPKFGAVSPPSNEPEVEPVATSEANKAPDLSTGQEAEAQSDLDEFDVETESVSKPESVEAFNLVTASAVAAEDSPLAEADEPVEAVPEADSFFGAEGADFISDDLPVDEDEVAAEDDDQPDTFGDIELEPAAPEAEFFASDVLSAPNDADAQIFDVSDLPEMGLPEGDAYAIGEEIDTLDELFQFEDFPTDVPEDLVEITDEGEALDSEDSFFGTSLDSDLVDASFASSKSGFIDDDFSDLRRDVTDVPIDSNFVAAVFIKSAAHGQSENEA